MTTYSYDENSDFTIVKQTKHEIECLIFSANPLKYLTLYDTDGMNYENHIKMLIDSAKKQILFLILNHIFGFGFKPIIAFDICNVNSKIKLIICIRNIVFRNIIYSVYGCSTRYQENNI